MPEKKVVAPQKPVQKPAQKPAPQPTKPAGKK